MIDLLKNKVLHFYASVVVIFILALVFVEDVSVGEFVLILTLFGVIFPSLAFLVTRRSTALDLRSTFGKDELTYCLAYMLLVTLYLTLGPSKIALWLGLAVSSKSGQLLILAQKLIVFVLVPFYYLANKYQYRLSDYGLNFSPRVWRQKKHIGVLILISTLFLTFQFFFGGGARPIREGAFAGSELFVGLPFTFLWLIFEVGLVEEFFFRGVLLPRLAKRFNSEISGVLLSSLLFGLAHAPGLYFRGSGVNSLVGDSPSLLMAVGYSVVVLGTAGIFLGVIYSRTRNLSVVIIIHALGDLLPNFSEIYHAWLD